MAESVSNIYQRLVHKEHDLATPSSLYHLEPIGLGTPYTESLTSYIARLAEAHCLTTGGLFLYELAPTAAKKYLFPKSKKNKSPLGNSFYPATPGLVSTGRIAEDWVRIIERLTLRHDLRYLTMLTWRNVFARKMSARDVRAWCSICLKEQKEAGVIVYEQLLWMQRYVHACPLHRKLLMNSCPQCGKQLRPLANRSRPGHCSSCGNWLGICIEENDYESSVQSATDYQIWTAGQVGELISHAPYLLSNPSKDVLVSAITKCVEACAGGFIPGFARYFGMNTITVRSWLNKHHVPMLDSLLKVSYELSVSLLDFITDKDLFGRAEVIRSSLINTRVSISPWHEAKN